MTNTSARIPKNINSYDSGNKPFKHDPYRGKWSSIQDFYLTNLIHSFGTRYFSILPLSVVRYGGIFIIIPYMITLFLFSVPIFYIQSFLGQFSQSGFISAYRISPLFKGLGYTILVMNIASVCYFSILASFPLVYIFASFHPQLPWMTCDNAWNSENCTVATTEHDNSTHYYRKSWSTEEFLENAMIRENVGLTLSWHVVLCTLIIWILVGIIIIQGIEKIGTILRYFAYIAFGSLMIVFIRILFVPGSFEYMIQFFVSPHKIFDMEAWMLAPIVSTLTFGSGWGTIVTMSSYNKFNTNVRKYSWIICFSHFGILTICGLMSYIMDDYLTENYNFHMFYFGEDSLGFVYAVIPYFFGILNGGNLWSILFYTALFVGELSGFVVQILSILTAIFDEYVKLRPYKRELTALLITLLMIFSLGFTINKGIYFFVHIFLISGGLSLMICFIELMIVVWVYGRLRFQRDIKFMIKETFETWQFYIIRFVTPLVLLITMFYNFLIAFIGYHYPIPIIYSIAIVLIKLIPFLIFPIYLIYKFNASVGTICERFKKLCRPTDWYPSDPNDQRDYEILVNGNSEILIEDNDIEYDEENNNADRQIL